MSDGHVGTTAELHRTAKLSRARDQDTLALKSRCYKQWDGIYHQRFQDRGAGLLGSPARVRNTRLSWAPVSSPTLVV